MNHLEHIGMATADRDASLRFYVDLLGMKVIVRRTAANGTHVAFVDLGGGALVEIMSPPGMKKQPARSIPNDEPGVRHITLAPSITSMRPMPG